MALTITATLNGVALSAGLGIVKVYQMHVSNEPIPKNKMRQFHEILCATGGRYTSNPRDFGDMMRVDYTPGDQRSH